MQAQLREVESQLRPIRDDAHVAGERDAEAGADRVSVDGGQGGAGQIPDRQEELVERAHAVPDRPSGQAGLRAPLQCLVGDHPQIAARREGTPAARQHHGAQSLVVA